MQGAQDTFSVDFNFSPSNMWFTPDFSSMKPVKLPQINVNLAKNPCDNETLGDVWRGTFYVVRDLGLTNSVSRAAANGALKQYKIDNGCK